MTFSAEAVNVFPDSPNSIHSDAGARLAGLPSAVVPGVVLYGLMIGNESPASHELRFHRPTFDGEQLTVTIEPESASVFGADQKLRATLTIPAPPYRRLFHDRQEHSMEVYASDLEQAIRPAVNTDEGARAAALLDAVHHWLMKSVPLPDPWLHASSTIWRRGDYADVVIASGTVLGSFQRKSTKFLEAHVTLRSFNGDMILQVVHTIVPNPRRRV